MKVSRREFVKSVTASGITLSVSQLAIAEEPSFAERETLPGRGRRKAKRMGATSRVPRRPGVVADPGMCGRSVRGNREISRSTVRQCRRSASGRRGAVADEARS
jgi:hypothetical protein